ncbi:unnamed protein product [Didymodactylos carnosus]|uniref:Uncharacterized protein n=1 Tax=Didymodactylos carnosus TaxID=1234261 RepID=A0A813STD8_9BILA|nr:unnamed protein product [Didymodactylos carnosus]CAF0798971.1 unnamed protein product [Didymodactylos carnosus]CAF3496407.1 unnamed protein product [Didymodactylos carnosus]CAF3583846.1 unnamed protein product [Didymodactylos carnosus]
MNMQQNQDLKINTSPSNPLSNPIANSNAYGENTWSVYTGPIHQDPILTSRNTTTTTTTVDKNDLGATDPQSHTTTSIAQQGTALPNSITSSSINGSNDIHNQFKVMLLGDSGVGKTCLLVRFKDGTFLAGSFIATVGIDFRNKIVTLGEKKIKLQIFDTAGQERFRSVTHSYYRDAHALLLLYDVTSYSSFENISVWLSEIKEFAHDDVIIMLIGNKIDKSQRVVSKEAGERLARDFEVSFLETSAKTGQNVELAFMACAQALIDKETSIKSGKDSLNEMVKMAHGMNGKETSKSSGWCC